MHVDGWTGRSGSSGNDLIGMIRILDISFDVPCSASLCGIFEGGDIRPELSGPKSDLPLDLTGITLQI